MRALSIGLVIILALADAAAGSMKFNGNNDDETSAGKIAIERERLRYHGYEIRKHVRRIGMEDRIGQIHFAEDEYAILSARGRSLFRFDAVVGGNGNSIEFGAFSFFKSKRKELLVSQDISRGGNQWIVRLGRSPRILYNGLAWRTGREVDDVSTIDLDHDGNYEFVVPLCGFYGFESLNPAATPLPSIIFKYSKRAKRFLPANPQFAQYILNRIEDRENNIHPIGSLPDNMYHLGDVMRVVLDYVFVGREREAWTFYDRAYKLPNKDEIKREIRGELKRSPVYRFIYRNRSSHRA